MKAVQAFLIFAAMVAVPIAADRLLRKNSDSSFKELGGLAWALAAIVGTIVLVILGYWYFEVKDRLDSIASCLKRAERDMNALLASAMEHGGRKGAVKERAEWHQMVQPAGNQIFNEGYRTPAHDIIEWNEKDRISKGTAAGKASATAFIFRELYEGSIGTARAKIEADIRNGGSAPYLAPGFREIIGTHKYDKDNDKFTWEGGKDSDELEYVVKHRKFPTQNLVMVKTNAAGERKELRGYDVLRDLTQQKL